MNAKPGSKKATKADADADAERPAPSANGNGDAGALENEMTIDELAQTSGMTVRNIRAHQSRGLLQAPIVRGRIGFYDDRHVARLELIQQLQSGGFNLTAIQRLVERAERTGDDIGNLRNLVLTSFAEEQSEVMTRDELGRLLGSEIDSRLIKKGIELGFVLQLDDDRFEVLSPTIMRAAVQCIELGVPLEMLINVLKAVNIHTRSISDAFIKMVDEGIIRPVEKDGMPPEAFPQVLTAIESLRPLAAEVALAGFRISMDSSAEDAFGKILRRIAKEDLSPVDDAGKAKERGGVAGAAKSVVRGAVKSPSRASSKGGGKDGGKGGGKSRSTGSGAKTGSAKSSGRAAGEGRRRGRRLAT